VLLGAAWSAFNLGDTRRAAPLAADGIACARQADEPQLEAWGRSLLAGLAWLAGDADRIVAEIEASQGLSGPAAVVYAERGTIASGLAAWHSSRAHNIRSLRHPAPHILSLRSHRSAVPRAFSLIICITQCDAGTGRSRPEQ
jgi:hypothetical protein